MNIVNDEISLDQFDSKRDRANASSAENEEVMCYIDSQIESILANPGVNHPFLNAYRHTKLTKAQEKSLYLETFYYFEHVPFYICSICTLTRDEDIMRQILDNVADEFGMNNTAPHSKIFLDFLEKLDISSKDIENYECLASTKALNKGIQSLYITPPIEKVLGALFAEETQSAAMVEKYNAGLQFNGHGERVRSFWTMHIEAEINHSNAIHSCIAPYLQTSQDRVLFEEGVSEYMTLLESYWDGIQARLANR